MMLFYDETNKHRTLYAVFVADHANKKNRQENFGFLKRRRSAKQWPTRVLNSRAIDSARCCWERQGKWMQFVHLTIDRSSFDCIPLKSAHRWQRSWLLKAKRNTKLVAVFSRKRRALWSQIKPYAQSYKKHALLFRVFHKLIFELMNGQPSVVNELICQREMSSISN